MASCLFRWASLSCRLTRLSWGTALSSPCFLLSMSSAFSPTNRLAIMLWLPSLYLLAMAS